MLQEGHSSGDPFRATKLWKEVISQFRAGMPCKRGRVKMRFYDRCFTGSEAVQWLHDHLSTTPTFGTDITRQKVVKLLKKFLSSDVIEEVRGKIDEFKEDSGYLYKFVTKPGPFNFVGDEISTPCKKKRMPMSVTPGSALGKRKRRRKEEEEDVAMDYDGAWFSNEHASTSCDEESFHAIATPVRGRESSWEPRGANVVGSGSSRRPRGSNARNSASFSGNLRRGSGKSGGLRECKESSGGIKDSNVMLDESPAKRCRKESISVSGRVSESLAESSMSKGGAEIDPTILSKVWKELTLNRLLLLIDLPSLDKVLSHDAVDGRHIAFNVSSMARMVGGACSMVGVACSSAAQTCLAAVSGASHQPRLPPPPIAPASHMMRRRSSRDGGRSSHHCSPFHSHHHWHRSSEGIHTGADGDFPQWVTLSMHCLSKWPESCSEEFVGGMPIYGGFELDVFQSLVHFFHSEPEPLISTALYDLHMAVLKLVRSGHANSIEAVQLCILLLPQKNHLRLRQVLHFISTASVNPQLRLSKTQSNSSVLLEKFGPVILRRCAKLGGQSGSVSSKGDLCTLVAFMVKHHQSILKVPEDLSREVQHRIKQLKQGKGSPVEVKNVFCQQVSAAQYEEQRKCHTHQHMGTLLEAILADRNMSEKEKCSKLKMFQKQYPDVYAYKMLENPHPLLELTNKGAKSLRRPARIF